MSREKAVGGFDILCCSISAGRTRGRTGEKTTVALKTERRLPSRVFISEIMMDEDSSGYR